MKNKISSGSIKYSTRIAAGSLMWGSIEDILHRFVKNSVAESCRVLIVASPTVVALMEIENFIEDSLFNYFKQK
jgi:hypothetical protein